MKIKIALLLSALTVLSVSSKALAANPPRTTTVWEVKGAEGVNVIPYVRVDKRALFIDFEKFTNISNVHFNLNYTNKNNGVKGGVEGNFVPSLTKFQGSYNGENYVRNEVLFGTCSQNVCTYHKPQDVTLTVKTTLSGGKVAEHTKVLGFPNDQF